MGSVGHLIWRGFLLSFAAIEGLPNVRSEFYSVALGCCRPYDLPEKLLLVSCNPSRGNVFP